MITPIVRVFGKHTSSIVIHLYQYGSTGSTHINPYQHQPQTDLQNALGIVILTIRRGDDVAV